MNSRAYPQPLEPQPPKLGEIVSEETCDIVIIGAGIAGCTAAQTAASAGASVICVEKFGSFTAHGGDVGAVGTSLQKKKGVKLDRARAARLIYDWGQQQANYFLIRTHVEKSGDILDSYIDMASRYGLEVVLSDDMTARMDWVELEDRFRMYSSAHVFRRTDKCPFPERRWSVAYFVEMVYTEAIINGAIFRFKTKAEQLVKTGETVTGVIVSDADGYKKINARKGVILATGGITDNKDMIRAWWPAALRADKFESFPVGSNMGDGLLLGAWAGAALSRCSPAPIIHPVNLSVLGPGINSSWLTVNRDGMRFGCEVGYEPMVTNARLNTPGNIAWAIWDADYPAHLQKQEPIKALKMLDGLETAVEKTVEDGEYIKGATLEELAGKIGVPPIALQATVRRYNTWCERGVDEDFGVPDRFLCPVRKAPFYATRINAWLLNIPYGLHVDQNSQVCREDDSPIDGLFAVGNVQGDFFSNSYPVTLPGTSHGRCITFGHLVGKALAEGTTINCYTF